MIVLFLKRIQAAYQLWLQMLINSNQLRKTIIKSKLSIISKMGALKMH